MDLDFEWIPIPGGSVRVGSTLDEIDQAFEFWKERLLVKPGCRGDFKSWLMKEYPPSVIQLNSFSISDITITNNLFRKYCDETRHLPSESLRNLELGGGETHPVWGVSFEEAISFCQWLSGKLGSCITLPTEAEWEYAARGSTNSEYPWGNVFDPYVCNVYETGIGKTTPVRTFREGRSYFGLYDMGGNVEEWVSSKYVPHPGGQLIKDDLWELLGPKYPILKGGSFSRGGDLARVARRHGRHPDPEFRFTGFRVVMRSNN
ncbi:formylglycine-generating enzyme family protein [Alicyclobacillus tolerans]|uniref:formylglycine-generating enzyme family protein n=1 Tax=Alicyclobacillus tolerans TaxID=90970 RepID=UPI003B80CFC5